MRRRGRRDLNHRAVVEALRACGWRVWDLADLGGGISDVLAYRPNKGLRLFEIKYQDGALTPDQEQRIMEGWPITVIRSIEQVARLSTESYDDRQAGAVLVTCAVCLKSVYMVVVHAVCQGCRK
jgi:hypothetical protein